MCHFSSNFENLSAQDFQYQHPFHGVHESLEARIYLTSFLPI